MPTVEQVRELLAEAGRAAAAGDDDALRRLFVDRRGVPDEEFQMFKASEFWTLTPARRVSRLGPDAFSVTLRAPAQKLGEAITVRKSLDLPLRWNAEGRLVILGAAEAERLARLPVPETPGGEPVVALVGPDDDSSLAGTNHFASEFWITASGETTRFHIRFDPPLVSAALRADLPPAPGASSFGGEIWVEFQLDADGDPATGTRLDRVYEQAGGTWATGAAFYRDFGIDRVLKVHGKKNVMPGGQKAWTLDVELMTHSAKPEKAGSDTAILTGGDSLVRKSVTQEGLDISGDVLVLTVPTAAAGVSPGGRYRVFLPSNSDVSTSEMKKIFTGRVGSS
jgi:hypothetical protein